eukprot:g6027.t1
MTLPTGLKRASRQDKKHIRQTLYHVQRTSLGTCIRVVRQKAHAHPYKPTKGIGTAMLLCSRFGPSLASFLLSGSHLLFFLSLPESNHESRFFYDLHSRLFTDKQLERLEKQNAECDLQYSRQSPDQGQNVGAFLATDGRDPPAGPAAHPVIPPPAKNLPAGTRVVLINLKRRPERLKSMQALAQQLDLLDQLHVQGAVDGTEMGEDGLRRYAVEKIGISAELSFESVRELGHPYSVFGTLFSHATAMVDFLESNDSFALVLEDDIYSAKGLDDAMRALAMLTELDPDSFDNDLSRVTHDPRREVRALIADPPVFRQHLFKYASDNRRRVDRIRFLLYRDALGKMNRTACDFYSRFDHRSIKG